MEHHEWPYLAAIAAIGIAVLCVIVWEPAVSKYLDWKTRRAFRQRDKACRSNREAW